MDRLKPAAVPYAVIGALVLLLGYPALNWLVRSWLANPYYSHGFLVPLVAALLAWRQWRHAVQEPRQGRQWLGLAILTLSLAVVVWAMRWMDYFVVSLALVGLVAGILLFKEGWLRTRHWLFPVLFLLLMVPLPFVDLASPWLEAFTARSATTLVRLLGITATQQGGEITLPGTTLVVGAPCSGLRSLVAMVTVGAVWVYLVRGRLIAKAAMLVAIIPLVAVSNIVRITILLVIADVWGAEIALSYYHDWSGLVLFLMALALLFALSRVLGCSQIRDDLF